MQVSDLMKQVVQLKTEMHAARVAAAHARDMAASTTSLWRLPRLLASSTGVHAMSTRWLEEAPAVKQGNVESSTDRSTLVACGLVAAATVATVAVFLFFPRYLL
jgi:hypothetical protein